MGRTGGSASGFFDSYRAAFETLDPDAISDYFTYPCHVVSDGEPPNVTVARSREEWRDLIAQLVALYRDTGVTSATALSTTETELSPQVVQAYVHWSILDAAGEQLYDFHALYTLLLQDGRFKIAAIAHDELPRLLGLMSAGGGSSA